MHTEYPNALDACFDHAGREMVEEWQDNNSEDGAERIAREYLLELQASDVIRGVAFVRNARGFANITITERLTMTQYLDIGTIIEGTRRPQDLLPAFIEALEALGGDADDVARDVRNEIPRRAEQDDSADWWNSADCYDLLHTAGSTLEDYVPPYCYFGTLEGDGACFGCWINHDAIRDAIHDGDMLQVSDLSEVPDDWSGEVLHVNDHGNTMLYARDMDQEYHEVWAVV